MKKYKRFLGIFLGVFMILLFLLLSNMNVKAALPLPRYFTVYVGQILDLREYEMETQKKELMLSSDVPKLTWIIPEDQEGSEFFINETQFLSNRVGWTTACIKAEEEEVCLPILVMDDNHNVIQEADRLIYIERDLPIIWAHDIQGNSEEILAQTVKEHIKFSDVHIPEASRNRMLEVEDIDPNHLSVISDYQEGNTWADISVFLDDVIIYEDILTIADERYKPEGEGWEFLSIDKICPANTTMWIRESIYDAYGAQLGPSNGPRDSYSIHEWDAIGTTKEFPYCTNKLWLKEDITIYNRLNDGYGQMFGLGSYRYPLELFKAKKEKLNWITSSAYSHNKPLNQLLNFRSNSGLTSELIIPSPVIYPLYSIRSAQNAGFSMGEGATPDVMYLIKKENGNIFEEKLFDLRPGSNTPNQNINIWRKMGDDKMAEGIAVVRPFDSFRTDHYMFVGKMEYNYNTGFIDVENRVYNNNKYPKTLSLIDIQTFDMNRFITDNSKNYKFDIINKNNKNIGYKKQYSFGMYTEYIDNEGYLNYSSDINIDKNQWYTMLFDEDTTFNWTSKKVSSYRSCETSASSEGCIKKIYENLISGKDLGAFYDPKFNTVNEKDSSILALTPTEIIDRGDFLSQKFSVINGEDNRLYLESDPSEIEVYSSEKDKIEKKIKLITTLDRNWTNIQDEFTLYIDDEEQEGSVSSEYYYTLTMPDAFQQPGVNTKIYRFQTRLNKDGLIYPSNSVTVPVSTYTFGATFSGAYYATSGQNIDPNEISKLLNTYYIKNQGGEPSYQWVDSKKCSIKNNTLDLNGSNQIIVPSNSNGKKYEACLEMIQQEEDITRSFNVKIPIEVVDKIPAGKQLYFEQSDVIIDKDFKDQSEYVQGNQLLELSQPFIKEGNQITSSYKQAPLSFKVKSITFNDDQTSGTAELCYTDSICDSITFSEQSLLRLKFKQALITMPKDLSNQKNDPDLNTVFLYKSQPYVVDENNEHKAPIDYEDHKDRFSTNMISIDKSKNSAKVEVCYEDIVCNELFIELTDEDQFIEWTKMKGIYNNVEKDLIIYGGETQVEVMYEKFEDTYTSATDLFLKSTNIIDLSNGQIINKNNIQYVNVIDKVKINKVKYINQNNPKEIKYGDASINGMFSCGFVPDKVKGFCNLKEVQGFEYFYVDNKEIINIDSLFLNSLVENIDLSQLQVTVQGNHTVYNVDNIFAVFSFYSNHIKSVILPPYIDHKNNVLRLVNTFESDDHAKLALIELPPKYQFNFLYKRTADSGNILETLELPPGNWINESNNKKITKSDSIVSTVQATQYTRIYDSNKKEIEFQKNMVILPDTMTAISDQKQFILQESQPFVTIGGRMHLVSYEQEPAAFSVEEINLSERKAKVCYNGKIANNICNYVSVTKNSLIIDLYVPNLLSFETIHLPIHRTAFADRIDPEWQIEILGIENLNGFNVLVSQPKYFSNGINEIAEGIYLFYDDQKMMPGTDSLSLLNQDFECEHRKCMTRWNQKEGLQLEYSKDLNSNFNSSNVNNETYTTQVIFTLSTGI